MDILRKHKLYAKASKCAWYQPRVEFLSHVITPEGLAMEPDKVAAIRDWPPPTNVSEFRSFLGLGLAGFYRRFVKGFSIVAASLTNLLCKGVPYTWAAPQQLALANLTSLVTSAPVLAIPSSDLTHPWVLSTDASAFAIGGVLSQDSGHGLRPVAFTSRKMTPAERNYPIHDKEMLSIIHAVKTWRCYIQGRHCTIYTDHSSLSFFDKQPKLAQRQIRWQELLSTFDVTIKYRPGKVNVVADALFCRPDLQLAAISKLLPQAALLDSIQHGYESDPLYATDATERTLAFSHSQGLWYFASDTRPAALHPQRRCPPHSAAPRSP